MPNFWHSGEPFMRRVLLLALAFLFAGSVGTFANPAYDPKPWLEDLAQMRAALSAKYADLEWAVFVREIDMSALFADTRKRIETGGSDADARAAFDRLIRRLGDGHVELHWPRNGAAMTPNAAPDACAHYDAARAARPLAAYAPGYVS